MDQTKSLSTKYRYRNVYLSKRESDPKIWGPSKWRKMFEFASKYKKVNPTTKDKNETYLYFKNLQLPCVECQNSYNLFWNDVPIEDYLSSRKLLIEWLYVIKHKVNTKLIQQEKNKEVSFANRCLKDNPTRIDFCIEQGKKMQTFHTRISPPLSTILNRYVNIWH